MTTYKKTKKKKFIETLLAHVNQPLSLEFGGKTYKSIIRGEKEDEYLIIDIPSKDGRELPFFKDEQCVVRFMHEGMVFGFITYMLKRIVEPVSLLIIEFPKQIEDVTLRKSERVNVFLAATIYADQNNTLDTVDGFIIDLSSHGCKLYIDRYKNFEEDQNIFISFTLPASEPIQNFHCFIKQVTLNEKSCQLGIEFHSEDSLNLRAIANFVQSYTTIKNNLAS